MRKHIPLLNCSQYLYVKYIHILKGNSIMHGIRPYAASQSCSVLVKSVCNYSLQHIPLFHRPGKERRILPVSDIYGVSGVMERLCFELHIIWIFLT